MTRLQALKRQAPDQPIQPEKDRRREGNERRNGTTTLIGSWEGVLGQMIETRLRPTRKVRDFRKHIEATVMPDEPVPWRFIMDNLSVHGSVRQVKWTRSWRPQRNPEGSGQSPSIVVRPETSDSLRVCAQTLLVAESDRAGVWDRESESDARMRLRISGGSGRKITPLRGLFQRGNGRPDDLDLLQQTDAVATARQVLPAPPPSHPRLKTEAAVLQIEWQVISRLRT